mmetsp:Transcript_3886/g.8331  ORF Transcript_3886/g.8331 Transcript_3886/m.8331 type:complete len:81 (+) Transcript_3886:1351-1593(+)
MRGTRSARVGWLSSITIGLAMVNQSILSMDVASKSHSVFMDDGYWVRLFCYFVCSGFVVVAKEWDTLLQERAFRWVFSDV